MDNQEFLKGKMRIIEGFPKEGISYKDITPILADPKALKASVDVLKNALDGIEFDAIIGIESRGFIFGTPLAYEMQKPFIMIRKPGKLPGNLIKEEYALEYGTAAIELDKDTIKPGDKIVIVDDLLATGGTTKAAANLVKKAGGEVACCLFLTELEITKGRANLEEAGIKVISILKWEH